MTGEAARTATRAASGTLLEGWAGHVEDYLRLRRSLGFDWRGTSACYDGSPPTWPSETSRF